MGLEVLFWRRRTVEASFDIVLYEQTQGIEKPKQNLGKECSRHRNSRCKGPEAGECQICLTAQRTVQVQ